MRLNCEHLAALNWNPGTARGVPADDNGYAACDSTKESSVIWMGEAAQTLRKFGVPFEIDVISAHRSPDRTSEYARTAVERGLKVIIVGAGGAAHLGGVVAAHTILPVIGVPIASTTLAGFDSLLSIVQMPSGIPVACTTVGKAGAVNAAILAVQVLAT